MATLIKRRYRLLPYLLPPLFLCLISCGGLIFTMEQKFLERKMTREKAETFAHRGLLLRFGQKDAQGNLIMADSSDGTNKKIYAVDYASATTKTKAEKLRASIEALEKILDPRSQEGISEYIDDVGIRDDLLRQLAVFRVIGARLDQINTYKTYLKESGFSEKEIETRKDLNDDLLIQYPWFDLSAITRFEPAGVTKAKSGEVPYHVINSADLNTEYQVIKDNPDYPEKDKTKETITVLEKVTLRFLTADMDKDDKPDFIEIYRLDNSGQPEKYPIMALHKTLTSSDPVLLSYDIDSPGNPSFGIPEGFVTVNGIKNGLEIMHNQKELFDKVLKGREAEKKLQFQLEKMKMQTWIVRPGDVITVETEINEDGWPPPSTPYKFGNNSKVFAKLAIPEKKPNEGGNDTSAAFAVEWIAYRYHDPASVYRDIQGRPVEFYRLNSEFAGKKSTAFTISPDSATIETSGPDGKFDKRSIKAMIEEHPFRIDYDSGDNRFSLVDENNDRKYEKRSSIKKTSDIGLNEKSIIKPKEEASTGSYYGH